ncbi:MAG: PAS domain S-box protein [Pseudomonadota bacterium]|nr:PAS domain S-box protein [Pseudomonadota bacterium]
MRQPARPGTAGLKTIALSQVDGELAEMQRVARLGSWQLDLGSDQMQWSEALFDIFGLDHNEAAPGFAVLGALLDADSLFRLDALVAAAIVDGKPYEIELAIQHRTGEPRWIAVRGEVVKSEWGQIIGLRGTALDITERCLIERALRLSEARFRAIFNSTVQFIGVMWPDGTVVDVNETALAFGGLKSVDVIGMPAWETYWFDGRPAVQEKLKQAIARAARGELVRYDEELRGAAGGLITVDFSIKPVFDANGEVSLLIPEGRDVTDERRNSVALAESEDRFRQAMRNAPIGKALVSPDGRFLEVNEALCTMLGYTARELQGKTFADVTHADDIAEDSAKVRALLNGERNRYRMFKRYLRADGGIVDAQLDVTLLRNAVGDPLHFISQVQDITQRKALEEEQKALNQRLTSALDQINETNRHLEARIAEVTLLQEQLQVQATHDSLTGLYNRRHFDEALGREVVEADAKGYELSLIIADLDYFKALNDEHGHPSGDAMLQAWAELVRQETRDGDVLCRYGGEEFALVLPRCAMAEALLLAERLRTKLSAVSLTSTSSGLRFGTTVSMGIACTGDGDNDADALIRTADMALYQAKKSGRNRVICQPMGSDSAGFHAVRADRGRRVGDFTCQ